MDSGTRVQLHPALDAWMRGDRYGEIVRQRPGGVVTVRLDKSHRVVNLRAADVTLVTS